MSYVMSNIEIKSRHSLYNPMWMSNVFDVQHQTDFTVIKIILETNDNVKQSEIKHWLFTALFLPFVTCQR